MSAPACAALSDQSPFREGHAASVPDDEVIEHAHLEQGERLAL